MFFPKKNFSGQIYYFCMFSGQHELVPANYNNVINEDHGTTEESERTSEDGKDATWRNLVTWSVTQEPGEINNNIDENDEYNVNEEEEVETREIRTLNLFPVMEKNQEKTGRFTEKKMNTKANQVCHCYYYYEFMPLKKWSQNPCVSNK